MTKLKDLLKGRVFVDRSELKGVTVIAKSKRRFVKLNHPVDEAVFTRKSDRKLSHDDRLGQNFRRELRKILHNGRMDDED